MGGNALKQKGITVRRINSKELKRVEAVITAKLIDLGIESWTPNSIKNKDSHGDADIYYLADDKKNIIELMGIESYVKNGNMIHYAFEGDIQVDLIKVKPKDWWATRLFYSNGDMGNFLGKVLRFYGFKLSHEGLIYEIKKESKKGRVGKKDFLISNNYFEIARLIGLDAEKIKSGFSSNEDLFDWVLNWDLCCPSMFNLEKMNSRDRIRSAKRIQYTEFTDYIKKKGVENKNIKKPCGHKESLSFLGSNQDNLSHSILLEEMNLVKSLDASDKKAEIRKKIVEKWRSIGYEGKELGEKVKQELDNG